MAFYRGEDGLVKFGSTSAAITALADGDLCVILTTGNSDFTTIGAADSNPDTIFTANAAGSGTGTAAKTGTVASTRSWSLTLDKSILETTSMGDTHATNVGSIISGSGTVELFYTGGSGETNNFVERVNTGNADDLVVFELFLDGSARKVFFRGVPTSTELTSTVGDISIVTVNFVTSGSVTLSI
jgi:hypothetical protein